MRKTWWERVIGLLVRWGWIKKENAPIWLDDETFSEYELRMSRLRDARASKRDKEG